MDFTFPYGLSSEISDTVRVTIKYLEVGDRSVFEDVGDLTLTELQATAQIYCHGTPLHSVAECTCASVDDTAVVTAAPPGSKAGGGLTLRWDADITLPVKVNDLSQSARLVVQVWAVGWQLVGTCEMSLFDECRRLRRGEQRLEVEPRAGFAGLRAMGVLGGVGGTGGNGGDGGVGGVGLGGRGQALPPRKVDDPAARDHIVDRLALGVDGEPLSVVDADALDEINAEARVARYRTLEREQTGGRDGGHGAFRGTDGTATGTGTGRGTAEGVQGAAGTRGRGSSYVDAEGSHGG